MSGVPDQAILWEKILGPKWIRFRSIITEGLKRHSHPLIEGFPVAADARVLDLGCGLGETCTAWALRVPQGEVLGLDICPRFIDMARQEGTALSNLSFRVADAETHSFEPEFDLCYSRFGCMFFERPAAGFANVRRALKPGGQLVIQVWRDREFNPWFTAAVPAVLERLPAPPDSGSSSAAGPFAMAAREQTWQTLEAAGFQELTFEVIDVEMPVGLSMEEALIFQMANGPVGQIIREAGDLAVEKEAELKQAIADVLRPYQRPDGSLWIPSSSWLILARNPRK